MNNEWKLKPPHKGETLNSSLKKTFPLFIRVIAIQASIFLIVITDIFVRIINKLIELLTGKFMSLTETNGESP